MLKANASTALLRTEERAPSLKETVILRKTGAEAFLVVDRFIAGKASGAIRLHSQASMSEALMLAKGMGYKNALFNIPAGGAKICIKKVSEAGNNSNILKEMFKVLRPLLLSQRLFVGPDMGVTEEQVIQAYEENDLAQYLSTNVLLRHWDGVPLVRVATAHGVVTTIKSAIRLTGVVPGVATVAVEGLGKIGSETVRQLDASNFRVVAVSNANGTLEDSRGLEVQTLLSYKREFGDQALPLYAEKRSGATWKANTKIYSSECDILVPGAGIHSLDTNLAHMVKAKLVVPFGNIALTPEAESVLFSRRIVAIPYYLASGGGVLSGVAARLGMSDQEILNLVAENVQKVVNMVLRKSFNRRCAPGLVAIAMVERNMRIIEGLREAGALLGGWWRYLPMIRSSKIFSGAVW